MTAGFAAVARSLRTSVRGRVSTDAELAPFTTYRLGGAAAILVEAEAEEDLAATALAAEGAGLPVLALGRGSNLLISDAGFAGIVLRLGKGFDWIRAADDDEEALDAGGATPLGRLANWAARRALTGLEFAVAIPATVGGAVRMNAGAHDSSFAAVLRRARIYRLGEAAAADAPAADLGLGYRSTGLGERDIVCAARLHLQAGSPQDIAARMQRYRDHRAATQPTEPRTAGSMFRNPPPPAPSAGRLIEECGLKGFRVGAVEVSPKHANFFVASAGARASQVHDLLASVQAAVAEATGVVLVPEVRLVGAFGGPPLRT
ncbi:MAG TPA: UDP-N-acetylmuramate dehydrogenase [Actinomycetota bacterium]|nr:UDP-N-acetylmuramate dehydrogenase [Actinomycetota bacterium]